MARTGRTKSSHDAAAGKPPQARPDYGRSAQDRFLSQLARERRKVVVFLTNGIKLEGEIKSYDEYAILLQGEMTDHVYKHAISTIQPLTEVVSESKVSPLKRAPRAVAGAGQGAREAPVEAGAKQATKEHAPRQPVIVVRPKRRLVKTVDSDN